MNCSAAGCAHKARLYGHVKGRTIDTLLAEAVRLKEAGFTALGHLNPLLDEGEATPYYKPHAAKIEEAIDNVRRLREAVGPKVDLCIEIHRRLTPPEAIALGRGIEKYTPMFFEDPLRPNSFDAMAEVARHIDIPIATGERFTSLYQFQTLLTRNAVQYLRPDVCLCGGITGAKKIAAIAEAHDAWIVPHNPLSPVSTAACLQIAACIPNFAIQEYPSRTPELDGSEALLGAGLASGLSEQEGGFIAIPGAPGIGVELVQDVERSFPIARAPSACGRTRTGRWWICDHEDHQDPHRHPPHPGRRSAGRHAGGPDTPASTSSCACRPTAASRASASPSTAAR